MTEPTRYSATGTLAEWMTEDAFHEFRKKELGKRVPLKNGQTGERIGEATITDVRRLVGAINHDSDGNRIYEVTLAFEGEYSE